MLPVRNPRCSAVLAPSGCVVVGDAQGIVSCFDAHGKGLLWTLDTAAVTAAPPAAVAALHAAASDKYFMATGQFVIGAKKGKAFYSIDVGGAISSPILAICVKKELLFLATRNAFLLYDKNTPAASLSLPSSTILDMVVIESQPQLYNVVLASSDKCLRIIAPVSGTISHELHLDHIPTCLTPADASSLLIGTSSGSILALSLFPTPSLTWSHFNSSSTPVRFIHTLATPSNCFILSGIESGSISLYTTPTFHDPPSSPRLFHTHDVPISGSILSASDSEYLISILSVSGLFSFSSSHESHVSESEIESLQKKIDKEVDTVIGIANDLTAASPNFSCESRLERDGVGVVVTIGTGVPISMVAVKVSGKCSVDVEGDKNPNPNSMSVVQKICVLKEPKSRIVVKVIPDDVIPNGSIECHLFSDTKPQFSTTVSQPLPALYFYERVAIDPPTDNCHVLTISSDFYVPDLLFWLSLCLPSVPDRLSSDVSLTYASALTGSFLKCSISKSQCLIYTDSICALGSLRDGIHRESSKHAKSVTMTHVISSGCIEKEVKYIISDLKNGLVIEKKRKMRDAIKEVMVEGGVMEEYQKMATGKEEEKQEKKVVWLKKYVVGMKEQYHKISGHAVRVVVDDVDGIIMRKSFSYADVVSFIINP